MSQQKNKKSIGDWFLEHSTGVMTLVIIGMIVFLGVVSYERLSSGWNDFVEARERSYEIRSMIRGDLLSSTDCKVLQGAILESISRGESSDEWFPDIDDRALKIGEQRYEMLGCKP